jgi:peptidoglycan/xylan/chitin deacetylase (PgdA/CDA1 family)
MYGVRTLTKAAVWLRSRFRESRALILGYHRVADESGWDPYALSVTPQYFTEQLEAVRKYATPISLRALTESLQRDDLPPRSVAITLDDGYVDNLHHAKPLLLHHECPATVFVATGYSGSKFWWDELAEMLQPSLQLPKQIRLIADDRRFERTLPHPADAKVRKDLVLAVYAFMRQLPDDGRASAIAQLWDVVGRKSNPESPIRAMTQSELCELAAGGFIDVGAHTVTHPFLSTLTETCQQKEIATSKAELEGLLGRPVTSFCFPNGSSSRVTEKAVRDAGFHCACASHTDVVWRRSDLFQLPRLWAPNCDGATFSRLLRLWMGN